MALPPRTASGRFRARRSTSGFRPTRGRLPHGGVADDAEEVSGVRRGTPIVIGAQPDETKATTKKATSSTSSTSTTSSGS